MLVVQADPNRFFIRYAENFDGILHTVAVTESESWMEQYELRRNVRKPDFGGFCLSSTHKPACTVSEEVV